MFAGSHSRASFAVKQQIKRLGFVTVEQGVRARLLAIDFELPPFGSAAEFFALLPAMIETARRRRLQ